MSQHAIALTTPPHPQPLQRHVVLARLTDKGHKVLPRASTYLSRVTEIVESVGGTVVNIWAALGSYDFVAIIDYPSEMAAFRATTKVNELEVYVLEIMPVFDMAEFLAAL